MLKLKLETPNETTPGNFTGTTTKLADVKVLEGNILQLGLITTKPGVRCVHFWSAEVPWSIEKELEFKNHIGDVVEVEI